MRYQHLRHLSPVAIVVIIAWNIGEMFVAIIRHCFGLSVVVSPVKPQTIFHDSKAIEQATAGFITHLRSFACLYRLDPDQPYFGISEWNPIEHAVSSHMLAKDIRLCIDLREGPTLSLMLFSTPKSYDLAQKIATQAYAKLLRFHTSIAVCSVDEGALDAEDADFDECWLAHQNPDRAE